MLARTPKYADNIDQIVAKLLVELINVERQKYRIFQNIEDVDKYIEKRIDEAKHSVLDLTWRDCGTASINRNTVTFAKQQEQFSRVIRNKLETSNIEYKQIFTFPEGAEDRIRKMEERIGLPGYQCGFFPSGESANPFPKLQFVLIDEKEVIFASSGYAGFHGSCRNEEIVGIMKKYFDECWMLCWKIK